MIPNDFGIIRNKDRNLFGLPFDISNTINISNYNIEVLQPAYIDGKYYNDQGAHISATAKSCAQIDISKYAYVFAPLISSGNTVTLTGLVVQTANPTGTSAFGSTRVSMPSSNGASYVYMLLKVPTGGSYKALRINSLTGVHPPVIGLVVARTDDANPKGVKLSDPDPDPDPDPDTDQKKETPSEDSEDKEK